ncbi:MAG: hypothetical protein K0S08_1785 [Gammaproteobacteria bacterium]|jgi:hypothetical protein|nr:hypothetical protein [Gammaproteobacteria bacterium]
MARHDKPVSLPSLSPSHYPSALYAAGKIKPIKSQAEEKPKLSLPFLRAGGARKTSSTGGKSKREASTTHEVQILQIIDREPSPNHETADQSTQTDVSPASVIPVQWAHRPAARPQRLPVLRQLSRSEFDQKPEAYSPSITTHQTARTARPAVQTELQRLPPIRMMYADEYAAELVRDCQQDVDKKLSAYTGFFEKINARRKNMFEASGKPMPTSYYSEQTYSLSEDEERSALSTPSFESRKTV